MLHQASPQKSVGTESTEAAETGMVPKNGIGTRSGTEVKTETGGTGTGPLPGITGVTNLAGTGMNVITGRRRTGRGHEKSRGIDSGKILEAKKPSRGPGLRNFCQDRLHPGLSNMVIQQYTTVLPLSTCVDLRQQGLCSFSVFTAAALVGWVVSRQVCSITMLELDCLCTDDTKIACCAAQLAQQPC